MTRENDILNELKSIGSTLGELPRSMPYSVPDGYFGQLPGGTLALAKDADKPDNVPVWGKTMPYSTPLGYFDGLAENIIAKANSKDALPGFTADMPFSVPAGYFESLPQQMLAAAKADEKPEKVTKVIPLRRTYQVRSIRWAAAAMLLIFIGLGGTFYFMQPASYTEKVLASVPRNEIQDYLQHTYRIDVDQVVNHDISSLHVDNKEIIQYLNETGWDMVE